MQLSRHVAPAGPSTAPGFAAQPLAAHNAISTVSTPVSGLVEPNHNNNNNNHNNNNKQMSTQIVAQLREVFCLAIDESMLLVTPVQAVNMFPAPFNAEPYRSVILDALTVHFAEFAADSTVCFLFSFAGLLPCVCLFVVD
jgi:hypothetical protein